MPYAAPVLTPPKSHGTSKSYPPLPREQARGTHSFGTGRRQQDERLGHPSETITRPRAEFKKMQIVELKGSTLTIRNKVALGELMAI